MTCTARIRPFPPGNDTEVRCERDAHETTVMHSGVLRDYAYQGSATTIQWAEADRRTFHDAWPGQCPGTSGAPGCVLPLGHGGGCAA